MREREQLTDSLTLYLQEVSKSPLLKAEEEIELARQRDRGREAGVRLRELEKDGLRPEERSKLESLVSQGSKAKETMVKSNSRLVFSTARKRQGQGVPLPDLIQEGNIGLLKAVEKFNPDRGFRFSTYAIWWIRQAVGRAVAEQGRTIRIAGHASEELSRFKRKTIELTARFGREPTEEELAKELGCKLEKVKKIANIPQITHSLDMPVGVEEDSYLGELIEDPDGFPPPDEATREARAEQVRKTVDSLPPREAKVLKLRFGLDGGGGRTLEEVAEIFGLTRERIRQIQAQALRKLRHPARARELKDFLESK